MSCSRDKSCFLKEDRRQGMVSQSEVGAKGHTPDSQFLLDVSCTTQAEERGDLGGREA